MKRKRVDDLTPSLKICASCHQEGHCNSRSVRCTNHAPRQGSVKPISQDPTKCIKAVYTTMKTGFAKLITNHHLVTAVQQQVASVTKNSFYATRLLQFHLQRCIETELPLPNLEGKNETTNWIRQIFTHKMTDPQLQHSYEQLCTESGCRLIPSDSAPIKSTVCTRMIADYLVNLEVFYNTVYDKMNKKWFRHVLILEVTKNGTVDQV